MSSPIKDRRPAYSRILDRLYDGIWDCWDGENYLPEKLAAPDELKLLWAAQHAVGDILNGGFYQFFGNTTGRLAPEAVKGLHLLGLSDFAVLVSNAMQFFGEPYPRNDAVRNSKLEAVPGYPYKSPNTPISPCDGQQPSWTPPPPRETWDPFSELDTRFFELENCGPRRFDEAANRLAAQFAER